MGQEQSSLPRLGTTDFTGIVELIKSGNAQRIVVLTGAGISTSAGIPDFRSPDTGLYANLARLNLPYPEAVFDISFFRRNPEPFYSLARELYPGKFRPTITHSFIRLLSDKGLLFKLFTQNIDCLEREAGVPDELIVEAHGSFARQSCIDCGAAFPGDLMKEIIERGQVPHCLTPECNGLVKPDIVFFGEKLPDKFFENMSLMPLAQLCIIMGTSLSVHPFAGLPSLCADGVPRLLINKEEVGGGVGSSPEDVLMLLDCDSGVRKLAEALGWLEELEALWETTNPEKANAGKEAGEKEKNKPPMTKDEELAAEVEKLTLEVDGALQRSGNHSSWTKDLLAKIKIKQQDADKTLTAQSGVTTQKPDEETSHKGAEPRLVTAGQEVEGTSDDTDEKDGVERSATVTQDIQSNDESASSAVEGDKTMSAPKDNQQQGAPRI